MKFGLNYPAYEDSVFDFIEECEPDFLVYSLPEDGLQEFRDQNIDHFKELRNEGIDVFAKDYSSIEVQDDPEWVQRYMKYLRIATKLRSQGILAPNFSLNTVSNPDRFIRLSQFHSNHHFKVVIPESGLDQESFEYLTNTRRHKFRMYYDVSRIFEDRPPEGDFLQRISVVSTPTLTELPDSVDEQKYKDMIEKIVDNKEQELYNFIFVPSVDGGMDQIESFTTKREKIQNQLL